jgi:predicted NBD/HSP70 family sugar kinase
VSEPGSPIGLRHAFEAGHLALDPYGPRCPCGQRGCLELAGAELRSHLQDSIVARLQGTRFEAASTPQPVLLGAAEFVFEPLLRDPAHALENVLPGA